MNAELLPTVDGLVSIIMPAFNAENTILDSIESVMAQTYDHWELLVTNDGSEDGTSEIVRSARKRDARIQLFELERHSGPAGARNRSIEEARGRYIAFLDSDDIWMPEKLEIQLALMRDQGAAFCFSSYRRISQDGSRTGKLIQVSPRLDYDRLLYQNVVGLLTVVVDQTLTGPLRMTDRGYDDYILWLDILSRGHTGLGVQQDLARYRIRQGSVSRDKLRAAGWVWNIYRNVLEFSFPRSAWYFSVYSLSKMMKVGSL